MRPSPSKRFTVLTIVIAATAVIAVVLYGYGDDEAASRAAPVRAEGDLRLDDVAGVADPQRMRGRDRPWSFPAPDRDTYCGDGVEDRARAALEHWDRMLRAIEASGREASLYVVPDKTSVYPEHRSSADRAPRCLLEGKDRFWETLAREGPANDVYELRSELVRRKADEGDRLFPPDGFTWTTLGALSLVDTVLHVVGDGIRVESGEVVARGGGHDVRRDHAASRVPGRTLLVCDEFACDSAPLFEPYFEHVRFAAWYSMIDQTIYAMRESDRIVFETSERLYWLHAGDSSAIVEAAFTGSGR